jgi:peptidoglycan/xylan/chitin deacetylase (PgdA/CDA1 family)
MKKTWITTSWDDGHPLDFRVADLLTKYGLSGTFYIPRAAETEVMTGEQVRELSARFEIGAHTLDHVYLNGVSKGEANYQIAGSKKWIEDMTGAECKLFCFPGGKFDRDHLPMLQRAGFQAARTVEMFSLEFPRSYGNFMLMPTTLQAFPHSRLSYVRNCLARGRLVPMLRYLAGRGARTWMALAEQMARRAVERGGVFHLWGHSWEIESTRQWKQLEELFAVLAQWKNFALMRPNSSVIKNAD